MEPLVVLQFAAPVAIAAVGETVCQRGGIINIGLEGTMLAGAFFATLTSLATQNPWLGILVGIAAGTIVSLISSWFTVKLAADQVVVGTAINLLAMGVTSTLFRSRFGQSGQLLSVPGLKPFAVIPYLGPIDGVVLFLLLSIPLVRYLLWGTTWGLALRASGEYPKSAEAAGFSVGKLRVGAMAIGGLFGGLAGAYLSLGIAGTFAENMTSGRGFVAIAMVTFGRWRPGFVFAAALLVGFAESMQFRVQTLNLHIPFQFLVAAPYILALLVLVIVGKGSVAPAALGVAYKREK